jgi:hypothetical protein
MILELNNYVSLKDIKAIQKAVKPFIAKKCKYYTYNRDGSTIVFDTVPELQKTDELLRNIFTKLQKDVIAPRYNPASKSGDTGYEYHLYKPGQICHHHVDGEFSETAKGHTIIRYASVVLHLNTVEQGGELIFPSQRKKVKTEAGKVVVFPPYGTHGHFTTPAKVNREVIVTWFAYTDVMAENFNG